MSHSFNEVKISIFWRSEKVFVFLKFKSCLVHSYNSLEKSKAELVCRTGCGWFIGEVNLLAAIIFTTG